ncbi:uncharacterized protein LOC129943037 isoform X1 [Eupeodes corollae]|uniref:uncharacterized protein LOC129943037 isoform X1 n=1 Tax=Eupeodes corollae TaxID=290404 RepID=UPI0024911D8D|nr:uncharacterized protein LOC129943037 isoform X1 [Eupeodes corollae]
MLTLLIFYSYLATGESQQSLGICYKCSASVVHNILFETTEVITRAFWKKVFPSLENTTFLRVAKGFEDKWNFPNCIGALDGKHIMIQSPQHSGSEFFNYKKHYSIVLMALCDADYAFLMCDVGAAGRQSDGGIFKNSEFGKKFYSNSIQIPPPRDVTDNFQCVPYVIVADDAFTLTENMLKPYSKRNLTVEERIFNYRLSRARRVIENSFGILVAKWRIFRTSINAGLSLIEQIVQCCVCLHNWLRHHKGNQYIEPGLIDLDIEGRETRGSWRLESTNMERLRPLTGNSATAAKLLRNRFAKQCERI